MRFERIAAILMFSISLGLPLAATAQDQCSEEDKSSLEACIADAKVTCESAFPQCESDAIPNLGEDLECVCEEFKNFGQYQSCVSRSVNAIRALLRAGLVEAEEAERLKTVLKSGKKECQQLHRERKRNNKGNKNKPGGDDDGPGDDDGSDDIGDDNGGD